MIHGTSKYLNPPLKAAKPALWFQTPRNPSRYLRRGCARKDQSLAYKDMTHQKISSYYLGILESILQGEEKHAIARDFWKESNSLQDYRTQSQDCCKLPGRLQFKINVAATQYIAYVQPYEVDFVVPSAEARIVTYDDFESLGNAFGED
ncbi:hypothetical protein G7Y89_g6653 [Cudoniella acicularis]|uniref:Uncharacterized protein n=1 Tax=Cudoniella acicularis TaxID=354080 RepID=A0A8H4W2T6_9HELO|nr:hypothetical protein G7Y89_g6653 [Cudoniella acicularis]